MSGFSGDVVALILLAMPGVLNVWFHERMVNVSRASWTGRGVSTVVWAAIAYLTYGALSAILSLCPVIAAAFPGVHVILKATAEASLSSSLGPTVLLAVLWGCAFGLAYGYLRVIAWNKKWMLRAGRWADLTRRFTLERHWLFMMGEVAVGDWVYIRLREKRAFTGVVYSLESDDDVYEVSLIYVTQHDRGKQREWPPNHVLYLPHLDDVEYIRIAATAEPLNKERADDDATPGK